MTEESYEETPETFYEGQQVALIGATAGPGEPAKTFVWRGKIVSDRRFNLAPDEYVVEFEAGFREVHCAEDLTAFNA